MADINDLNDKLQELNRLISQLGREGDGFRTLADNIERAVNSGQDLNRQTEALNRLEQDVLRTYSNINNELGATFSIFQDINQELSRNNSSLSKIRKSTRGLESITSQLLNRREGISKLDIKDLKKLQEKSNIQFKTLAREKEYLDSKEALSNSEQIALTEINGILKDNTGLQASFTRELQATLGEQEAIENSLGLTGSILKGITQLPGLSEISKYLNVDSAVESMEDYLQKQIDIEKNKGEFANKLVKTNRAIQSISDKIQENEEKIAYFKTKGKDTKNLEKNRETLTTRLSKQEAIRAELEEKATKKATSGLNKMGMALVGLKDLAKGFAKTITSPEVIIGSITKSFLEFNKANREVRQLTGQTADNFNTMNMSLVSTTDQVKTIGMLSKQLGINVNAAFSPDTILAATELTELMGVSAESTANLAMMSEAFGYNLDTVTKDSIKLVSNFNKTNKTAINYQQVMEDVGKASGQLTVSLGQNPDLLIEAASAATRLGLSLKEVEQISDSLIQFQSSIRSELEAELLTGKQINLERARYAALNNDIKGVSDEIINNQEILNAFTSGNRIQQQAIAKALGMSTDQMGKMILMRRKEAGLTDEQAMKAANISEEELKRLDVQAQIQKSIEKLSSAFAPILEMVAKVLDNTLSLSLVLGSIAAMGFAQLITSLRTIRSLQIGAAIASAWKSAFSGPQSILTGGIAGAVIGAGLTALIMSSVNKAKKEDDFISPGYGKRVLSGPEGTFAFNDKDTIVAGTNLLPNNNTTNTSNQTTNNTITQPSINIAILEAKMDKLISVIENSLVPAVKQDKIFALDGKQFAVATAVSRS